MRKLFQISVALALAVVFVLPAGLTVGAAPLRAGDRVTTLPQLDNRTGPRVESTYTNKLMGYTVVLTQFKSPLLASAAQRKLAANDAVLQFAIQWRHGDRQLSGLLHAFRHGAQLHLSVHQKVYFRDRAGARPTMVPFDLEGTVDGVRMDAKGFLIGTRARVDFKAKLSGDVFGSRMILSGPLSIRRIGV